MLEIHGDAVADHGLHLAQAPILPVGVADEIAGSDEGGQGESLSVPRINALLIRLARGLSSSGETGMV
jgi:hypothetical protein